MTLWQFWLLYRIDWHIKDVKRSNTRDQTHRGMYILYYQGHHLKNVQLKSKAELQEQNNDNATTLKWIIYFLYVLSNPQQKLIPRWLHLTGGKRILHDKIYDTHWLLSVLNTLTSNYWTLASKTYSTYLYCQTMFDPM